MSVVRLIVATRSSGQPASQPVSCLTRLISGKIIKEIPGSVASGTPYIITRRFTVVTWQTILIVL